MSFIVKDNFVNFLNLKTMDLILILTLIQAKYQFSYVILETWTVKKQKKNLNKLWENFKLPVIGWKNNCKVLNYKDINDNVLISEYIFTMHHFTYWKTMADAFQ